MKKTLLILALALSVGLFGVGGVRADHALRPEVVRVIKLNAETIKRDAASYQRKRVNSRVTSLLGDVKKLLKTMAPHDCLKDEAEAIKKAASDLRSASMDADAKKTAEAVTWLSELSEQTLKKVCGKDTPSG